MYVRWMQWVQLYINFDIGTIAEALQLCIIIRYQWHDAELLCHRLTCSVDWSKSKLCPVT